MEEKVIVLNTDTYEELVKMLNSGQQNIIFGCNYSSIILTIPNNKAKTASNLNRQQNIVQKWMNEIIALAENGYRVAGDSDAERYFTNIKSYCKAVIISVTS